MKVKALNKLPSAEMPGIKKLENYLCLDTFF